MATKTPAKKAAAKKAPARKAARKAPRHLFTQAELNQIDAALRPAVGDTLTNKVIKVLKDAVGTPAQ